MQTLKPRVDRMEELARMCVKHFTTQLAWWYSESLVATAIERRPAVGTGSEVRKQGEGEKERRARGHNSSTTTDVNGARKRVFPGALSFSTVTTPRISVPAGDHWCSRHKAGVETALKKARANHRQLGPRRRKHRSHLPGRCSGIRYLAGRRG